MNLKKWLENNYRVAQLLSYLMEASRWFLRLRIKRLKRDWRYDNCGYRALWLGDGNTA